MTLQVSTKVIRDIRNGCFRMITSPPWGSYFSPCEDPEGVELTEYELNGIRLIPNFPKIPAEMWSAYISLCFYLCPNGKKLDRFHHDSILEVQVCLLRKAGEDGKLTQWKLIVPEQRVSGVTVKATLKNSIDILTGERYYQFPPKGWKHAGTSHSHNRMDAFYSPTDDKSELNVPGLHIVVGDIDHQRKCYDYVACIVGRKQRKKLKIAQVVDVTAIKQPFHPDVLEYIKEIVSGSKTYAFPGYTNTLFDSSLSEDTDNIISDENLIGDEALDDDYLIALIDATADAIQVGGYTFDEIVEHLEENREALGEPDEPNVEIRIKDGVYENNTFEDNGDW